MTPTPHDITSAEKATADVVYQIRETCVVMEDGECAQQYVLSFDEAQKAVAALIESQRATIERVERERDEARESLHYANGTADLAIKHRDAAEARVTALEAEKAGDGWLDISTAPRDGARFLATGGGLGSRIDFASYNDRVGCWDTTEFSLDDTDYEPEGYSRPTLWHPLPELPQALSRSSTEVKNDGTV